MGAVRYLCITIFLVFLCSVHAYELDVETTPMPANCGVNGRLLNNQHCLCKSGFAGELCDNNVLEGCSAAVHADQLKQIKLYPDLSTLADKIDFTTNVMTLNIFGEHVANRTYTSVTFVGAAANRGCSLGETNSIWAITADSTVCKDRVKLTLPWALHTPCGFVKTANTPKHYQYKATILLGYTDEVGYTYEKDQDHIALTRRTQVSYDVYIRFLRSVEVNVTEVLIESVVNQRAAITAVLYNPENQHVQIDVAVFTLWPNMLIDDAQYDVIVVQPDGVRLVSNIATSTDINCPFDAPATHPTCQQRLRFFIDMAGSCSFDGEYTLQATVVTCRHDYETCTRNATFIDFTINKSNVCGEVTAEPLVSGKLVAFKDAEHTEPTTAFLLGEYGYFATEFTSVNTVNMSYIDIWVTEVDESGDEIVGGKIYLYQNYQIVTDYSGYSPSITNPYEPEHGPTRLEVNGLSENMESSVTDDVRVMTPHFSFLFHSAIFTTPARGSKIYNVHATGLVTYLGNEQYTKQKREETVVNFVWKVDTASLDSTVQVAVASKADQQVAAPSSNNVSLLAAVLPVAGVALVAVVGAAVVAAIVIKRRKTTSYQTFNTIATN